VVGDSRLQKSWSSFTFGSADERPRIERGGINVRKTHGSSYNGVKGVIQRTIPFVNELPIAR